MRNESCPQEDAVLKALRSNDWTDGLRKHFQECSVCQEAAWSAEWIRNAAVHDESRPLPDPDVMWIQASIAAREREAIRSVWFSAIRYTVIYGSLCAGGTWLVLDWLKANLVAFGVIPLSAVILTVAVAHFRLWRLGTYSKKTL